MQDALCELRFDIPLPSDADARCFERVWRAELAAQKMTALAMPPSQAVAARFRVCGPGGRPELSDYLAARLKALPGNPDVAREPPTSSPEWAGVRIWLAYRPQELTALLQTARQKTKKPTRKRGQHP